MKDHVIVKSFSGDTLISCNEYNIHDYYDMDLEIDDGDFIVEHKIDRIEQHFYLDTEYTLYINYYNEQGVPYKFDEIKNGVCTTSKEP